MKRWLLTAILGCLPALTAAHVGAASTSNWPALDADAAHTNSNPDEKTLTAKNVLKLQVKWAAPVPTLSYPVVMDGRVYVPAAAGKTTHVHVVDVATGKTLATFTKDASGGILATDTGIVLAGHVLQSLDAATGKQQAQIDAPVGLHGGIYLDPVADSTVVVAGYATSSRASTANLYSVDLSSSSIVHTMTSSTALGIVANGRILTDTPTGGAFYDEKSGKSVAKQPAVFGPWFAGTTLSYTVAPVQGKNVSIMAYDGIGRRVWKRVIGPAYSVLDWPHAVTPAAVYVERAKPTIGVEALDPITGAVLWQRTVANVQRLAEANGVLYVLSYNLGVPVRLVMFKAATGAAIGAVTLSTQYYAYPEQNDLMIADGTVFLRVVGPGNVQQLLALRPGTTTAHAVGKHSH
jgi:hypothetical protein